MNVTTVDVATLQKEIFETRRELFNLRLSVGSGQVKDMSQFGKLRRKIAQMNTQIRATQFASAKHGLR